MVLPAVRVGLLLLVLRSASGLRVQKDEGAALRHAGPSDYESWPLWKKGLSRAGRQEAALGSEYFLPAEGTEYESGARCSIPGTFNGHRVGNVSEPALTPFLVPAGQPGRTDAAAIVVPGGGYFDLNWEGDGVEVAKWLNSIGISAFVLRYRMPTDGVWEHFSQVMDVQRAIAVVRQRAPSMGLNTSRLGLFGAGNGGRFGLLASTLKHRFNSDRNDDTDDVSMHPDFAVALYPALPGSLLIWESPDTIWPGLWDPHMAPPTLVISAADDQCVYPQDIDAIAKILEPVRERVEFQQYKTGGHGFGFCKGDGEQQADACAWPGRAEAFLRRAVLHQQR